MNYRGARRSYRLRSLGVSLLCTLALSPVITSAVQPTVAHAIRPTQSGDYEDWNPNDPASWSQNPDGNPNHFPPDKKKGQKGFSFNGSGRFTADACMIYSLTFLYLKAGVIPVGSSPADVHDMVFDSMKSYGWMNYDLLTDDDMGGKLELVEKGTFYNNPTPLSKLKSLWEQGYLLILDVPIGGGLHAITVDKIEGDTVTILDSGNWGTKLSDYYGNNAVVGYQAFKLKDGRKAKDTPVLNEHPDGNFGSPVADTTPVPPMTNEMINFQGGGGVWTPDESAIPNMPSYREFLEMSESNEMSYRDFVNKLNSEDVEIDFGQGTDGAHSIAKWKEERNQSLSRKSIDTVRTYNMVFAFSLVILTAPLVLLHWIDRFNVFGFELVKGISGGRLRSMSSRQLQELRSVSSNRELPFRAITDGMLFVYVAIISFFVVLILSGVAYQVLSALVDFLQNVWGYVTHGWL